MLDGGLAAWLTEGRDVDAGHVGPDAPADALVASPQPGFWADKAEVERVAAGEQAGVLVCGVPPAEFSGEVVRARRAGHIPGSVNVPAGRLVDRASRTYLPWTDLKALYPGVAAGDRVIAYCTAGIAATANALSLTLAGHTDVAVFDGSLLEWTADPAAPLSTGDASTG